MEKAILGTKVGMTQIFDQKGNVIPVTVIKAGPCMVVQKKTEETDGYKALQVGFEDQKEKRLNKPKLGHFKKADVTPKKYLKELSLSSVDEYEVGQEIKADIFKAGDLVDVTGISKGKGFTGSIKRHGQRRGPMSHGSHYHRGPGSMGSVDAARVFKGRPLPGRKGGDRVTVQKLSVAKVYPEKDLILIRGSVPGPKGVLLVVKDTAKKDG
ncbi:50S ribosomal protein L3 [Candidatus Contubernalis alkaliaceticus]|uniref:50S ribosomal protein L3 n=1 Tax=Candidatus Contubernalis alkaliaceticus TaxID=338645 RepID=UPI001F4BD829|nr:50S ribosomal protein L3 [Candidatus Contubernalis alkalaceticus]UNC90937.1 50S ribosomal protein L3 [Candidatus Contubernalis alkalaceticus]